MLIFASRHHSNLSLLEDIIQLQIFTSRHQTNKIMISYSRGEREKSQWTKMPLQPISRFFFFFYLPTPYLLHGSAPAPAPPCRHGRSVAHLRAGHTSARASAGRCGTSARSPAASAAAGRASDGLELGRRGLELGGATASSAGGHGGPHGWPSGAGGRLRAC